MIPVELSVTEGPISVLTFLWLELDIHIKHLQDKLEN